MMYPLFLDLSGKRCLVVGGGRIALRKVIALLRAHAVVAVVAKQCCRRFTSVAHRVQLQVRPFDESDIDRSLTLVIGATDCPDVNRQISVLASLHNIPCNIVDQPDLCSFIVPAVVRRGDITIAISTGGAVPRLSRYLKTIAARAIGPQCSELAAYLAAIRLRLRADVNNAAVRAQFWESLFTTDPLEEIDRLGWEAFRIKTERLLTTFTLQTEKK
jgi:siroheme synthase-like protein